MLTKGYRHLFKEGALITTMNEIYNLPGGGKYQGDLQLLIARK